MRKIIHLLSLVALCTFLLAPVAFAADENLPKTIPLPNGWRPEGITAGKNFDFYVGSLADGAIYKGDLRTGQGAVFVPGQAGRVAVGLYFFKERGYLFVAGGPTGTARVIDTETGGEVASVQLVSGANNFINDVVVTHDAAYFTNSSKAEYYRLPLSKNSKQVETSQVQTIPLSGDWQQVAGFNANGIEASNNGKQLIIVNSTTGLLYRVAADTGVATQIDLGGAVVTNGDGIRLVGSTLYVVRNQLNQIAVIKLNKDLAVGRLVETISDPAFRVPTTITRSASNLYVVNARFDTPPTPTTDYDVVRVDD